MREEYSRSEAMFYKLAVHFKNNINAPTPRGMVSRWYSVYLACGWRPDNDE